VKKVARGLVELYRAIPDLTNIYLFAFLIAAFIWLPKTPERRLLYAVFLWALGIQVVTSVFTTASDAPLGIVRPLATGLSVAAVVQWLRGIKVSRGLRLLAAAGVVLMAAVPYLASTALGKPVSPGISPVVVAQFSKGLDLQDKAVILTDNPWAVAWYGPHRAVLLPKQPQDMAAVARLGRAPHLVYLTRDWMGGSRGPKDPWRQAVRSREETKKLGLPLKLGDELLTLTPLGAKELQPETKKRFEGAIRGAAERARARAAAEAAGKGPSPAENQ
jgi:hypothetical protein